jgi:hypothetical protein
MGTKDRRTRTSFVKNPDVLGRNSRNPECSPMREEAAALSPPGPYPGIHNKKALCSRGGRYIFET